MLCLWIITFQKCQCTCQRMHHMLCPHIALCRTNCYKLKKTIKMIIKFILTACLNQNFCVSCIWLCSALECQKRWNLKWQKIINTDFVYDVRGELLFLNTAGSRPFQPGIVHHWKKVRQLFWMREHCTALFWIKVSF